MGFVAAATSRGRLERWRRCVPQISARQNALSPIGRRPAPTRRMEIVIGTIAGFFFSLDELRDVVGRRLALVVDGKQLRMHAA